MRRRAALAAAGAVALSLGFVLTFIGSQDRTPAGHRESSQTIAAAYVPSDLIPSEDSARADAEVKQAEAERLEAERLERVAAEEAAQEKEHEEAHAVALAAEKARKAAEAVVATPTTVRAAPVARTPVVDEPVSGTGIWWKLALCESGGTNANTGNGYFGYFQFLPSTWRSVGGSGLPTDHSYATQVATAQRLQARSGWGQWPSCSRQLGLR